MGTVFLDFDGTLAHRPGMWRGCLVEVLDLVWPGHRVLAEDIRPHLRNGFPWHTPERDHLELATPDQWWENMNPLFRRAFVAVGVPEELAHRAVPMVRLHYCDPARFHLYPDTVGALTALRRAGWELVILSNHVPELADIVEGVGLGSLVDRVFTSAITGYEKPHPEAFRIALAGADPEGCCMVGDNAEADVRGALAAGLPAIGVRRPPVDGVPWAADLNGAAHAILGPRQ